MRRGSDRLNRQLADVDAKLASLRGTLGADVAPAVDRWRHHAAALRFHLAHPPARPLPVVVLGGTGTGKSTLVNRVLDGDISATSFRRTFTDGPVAVVSSTNSLPAEWSGLMHLHAAAGDLPVRGEGEHLTIVAVAHELTGAITLVDTPDLDGEERYHHELADRIFRWCQAAVFVATPEKYQMTELPGYARLARRYHMPVLFVMNKCEDEAVVEDWRRQLADRDWPDAPLFAVPRDDCTYEPAAPLSLAALGDALSRIAEPAARDWPAGLARRSADLIGRLRDQIILPLQENRRRINALLARMTGLQTRAPGIDVSLVGEQLRRRMREQSILYLMGPQRVVDRIRQMPGLIARMPRMAWDFLATGEVPRLTAEGRGTARSQELPDYGRTLRDQFIVVQSRFDDLLRADAIGASLIERDADGYAAARIDPDAAARIAAEELADLEKWLKEHAEAEPRDTRVVRRLLQYLPGERTAIKLSEAAPYLLALAVVTHGAFLGPIDLLIIGGFSAATWLGQKLSDELAARVRRTNRNVTDRFEALAREQGDRLRTWLDRQAPTWRELERLDTLARELERTAGPAESE
jgi:hypothetical protein